MTTICFGPPPLPPSKKSAVSNPFNNTSYGRREHHPHCLYSTKIRKPVQTNLLSSTYQSFREQIEDEITSSMDNEEIEISTFGDVNETNRQNNECRKSSHKKKCTNKKCIEKRNRKRSCDDNENNAEQDVCKKSECNKSGDVVERSANDDDNNVVEKQCAKRDGSPKKCSKKLYYNEFIEFDKSADVYEIEKERKKCTKKCGHSKSCRKALNNTNSLSRGVKMGVVYNGKLSLARSHSEGNLAKKAADALAIPPPATFNKCLKALSGSWKNLLQLGGMSRPPKPTPTAKKVAPPAVPHEFRHSGSSFGSAGYASSEDGVFLTTGAPPGCGTVPPSSNQGSGGALDAPRDDHSDYGSTVSGMSSGKSPGPLSGGGYGNTQPAFTFPGVPSGQVLSHKAAVYYHHQLSLQEDQGIDMTQSPGRDSPGSSSGSAGSGSRHSTASLDSGRASAYHHPLGVVPSTLGLGLGARCGPGTASGSGGSPRCSLSSCSIGSSTEGRIERLIAQGIPDQDIIHAWLTELHFEEYFPLFMSAGYDLPTIGRMTPEDLTAIGIKKPNHRKRLKAEIAQLNLPDNLPDYIPGSIEEWLRLLRLEEYGPALHSQGYRTVEDALQLTWEDLEDIGIVKLGHQKKVMLAIKRVKDIRAGKRFHAPPPASIEVIGQGQEHILITSPLIHAPPSGSVQPADLTDSAPPPANVHTTFKAFHQPWEVDQTRQMTASCYSAMPQHYYQPMYCTDIVPIKIRGVRGKSLESLEDPNERSTHHTFNTENTQTFYYQQTGGWRPRSYDDGDITPTNEMALMYEGGGGTLPRPRGLVRPRPVAKIQAKSRDPAIFHDYDHQQKYLISDKCFTGTQYKSLPRDFIEKFHHFGVTTSPHKKMPPSPPKRQSSNSKLESCITENLNTEQTVVEIHTQSSPLPLPAYPSSDSLSITLEGGAELPLPPPPAPATPPATGPHRMLPSRSWGSSGEEQELIAALAMQHRNGSDASFKSSSSTESDSLPFANENAGTIKTRAGSVVQRPPSRAGIPPHSSPGPHQSASPLSLPPQSSPSPLSLPPQHSSSPVNVPRPRSQPADVLNDIGNMLANLTDELDAMLEAEKRQGLTDVQ